MYHCYIHSRKFSSKPRRGASWSVILHTTCRLNYVVSTLQCISLRNFHKVEANITKGGIRLYLYRA